MKNLEQVIEDLRLSLKVKFGLPQNRPTDDELKKILNDISQIPEESRTEEVWRKIVYKYVSGYKYKFIYEGQDNSDLNSLHDQILMLLRKDND